MNVTSAEEAEELTSAWLKNKFHDKFKKARLSHVVLENGIWQIKAELELKGARALKIGIRHKVQHQLLVSIDSLTGKVVSYKEGPPVET